MRSGGMEELVGRGEIKAARKGGGGGGWEIKMRKEMRDKREERTHQR